MEKLHEELREDFEVCGERWEEAIEELRDGYLGEIPDSDSEVVVVREQEAGGWYENVLRNSALSGFSNRDSMKFHHIQ